MDKPPRIHRKRGRSRIGNRTSCQKSVKALSVNLWSLPQEVLLHIVQNLHVKELLNLIATHPYFRDLLSSNPSIWQNVSYHGTWPTVPNMKHFMRAAEHSNIEALVKLGVAFLYNEGLPGDFEGKKITTNGERAAEMFCRVEVSTPSVSPFTWLFIRPPWAMGGACCKECVFNNMKDFVSQTPDPSIHICIAKIMGILGIDDYKDDIEKHLTLAKNLGSSEAAFLLWTHKYCQCCRVLDCASNLEGLRDLRQIAMKGYYEAQLALSKRYVSGKYGGIGKKAAATFVQNFIQSSEPTFIREIYRFNELTHSMRYILMDWLVEVACMKDFSSLTLHMAISVVDRFLLKHKTTRATLQLLGVAAMVLCSRVLGTEIITIREAAWLTDNTYKYEDVVRMMGEITATLGGKFRVPVALDYVSVLCELAAVDTETSYLAEYFCELALLQSSLGDFSRAHVAAATLLMARIVRKHENPWPSKMHEFTGFQAADLNKSMLLIHDKCFMDSAMVDHRDVVLQAVKERFADEDFMFVSNIKIMSKADFCTVLGVPVEPSPPLTPFRDSPMSPTKPHSPKDLIASPCRGGSSRGVTMEDCVTMDTEREQAATPTLQAMKRGGGASNKMNESVSAGYDGDREDEGESFLEQEGYDSDPDVEIDNLWSTDPQWHDSHSHVEVSSYDEEESYYVPGPPWLHQKPAPAAETPDSPKQTSPQLVGSMSVPVTSFTFGGVSPLRLGATLSSPDPSGNGLWKSTLKSLTENSKKTMWNVTVRSRIYRDSSFVMSSSACDSGVEHSAKKSTKSATVTKPLSAEASPYFTRSCTSKTHSPSVTEDNTAPDGSSSKLPLSTLSTANQDIAGKTTRSSRKRRLSSDQEVMRENKVRILQDK